jgi:hypothetical protein
MMESYIPVILIIVAVFYGFVPIMGAFFSRYKWVLFRRRFEQLRLSPLLDYRHYRQKEKENAEKMQSGNVFRFTGEIESITDGHTLWVRGNDLTIPVSLAKTKCYLLPIHEGEGIPEAPEQIRWNRVSTLTERAKVFIGGQLKMHNNRLNFSSTKEKPLMVIFYNCPDAALTGGIIRAARTRNEYWNTITPISLVIGALALLYIAVSFLNRPAFRLNVIISLVAVFIPILPMFPPGFLLTVLYRRMTWHARRFRAFWDIVRLPMRYMLNGKDTYNLTTGETYGFVKTGSIPGETEEKIPFLLPEYGKHEKKNQWRLYGVIDKTAPLPLKSKDPFVSYGLLPDSPQRLARYYAIKAYTTEALAWLILLSGIAINIIFIFMILSLFQIVQF